jgi:RND family efflux transporter MFP subunit
MESGQPTPTTEAADQHKRQNVVKTAVIVIAVLFAGLFVLGALPRFFRKQELQKMHAETVGAIPVVHTIIALPASQSESITLPGNVSAIQYTTIYARVDGYLKKRFVDIGDQVKAGQLLALIDTPTIDQELAQSRADFKEAQAQLAQAQAQLKEAIAEDVAKQAVVDKTKANQQYAAVTAKRWQDMCARGAVSQQSRDEKVRSLEATTAEVAAAVADEKAAQSQVSASKAKVAVAKATVEAKDAAVKRYQAEQSFQRVVAPFDGIITYRKVDPGALITQGSQSTNLELYQMGKIDTLRIYVSVPQRVARYLKVGMTADVMVSEYPERIFAGKVTNVSGGLDPSTRTRQTEIHIPNYDHALLPGMYGQVKLTGLREEPWIKVPGTTLVTKSNGQFVVVVKDGKAHYQPITIGRDFGDQIEIKMGLKGHEQVVVSPSDDLLEGEAVKPQLLES